MSKPCIMVIDDEKIVGDMAKFHLKAAGYDIETFVNAAPALERAKTKHFDVVITDLKMKGIDGMEVLKTIKAISPSTKVIMITAFANLSTTIDAFRGQIFDFFPKPFKVKDFMAAIERALKTENEETAES